MNMKTSNLRKYILLAALLPPALAIEEASAQGTIPDVPLNVRQAFTPLNMLIVGRDHTLFFEAYNDVSDIDGDGVIDLRFKPEITYYGYFDPTLCYTHTGGSATTGRFQPASLATNGKCSGQWSGNWLNYVTTSRIDALRKVLYGGHREVDTASQTILRRAYIPQDGHSWAKEYSSIAVDGYNISEYTPLNPPTSNRRHFFGNVTMNGSTNCSTLSNCSNLSPLLSVVTNSNKRVWEWASKERPVLDGTHGGTRTDYTVRVEVCTAAFNNGCKRYPNGNYKPIGLLHEYGENDSMYFGLLTGSYDKNMSGGVLRKVVASFKGEITESTGVFTSSATIVQNMNNLRIRDYNNGRTDQTYRNGSFRTAIMNETAYVDWGNPVGEMMYEALRYFAGKKTPTAAYNVSTPTFDNSVGLTKATWDDPYSSTSAAKAPWCAKPNMMVMSSTAISYDSNQLQGSSFGAFSGDITGLDVSALANTITSGEPDIAGLRFIGAVGSNEDYAPTVKAVSTLANIRGLSPEEPTKQGSYYSASVGYFGKINDLNPAKNDQVTDTYAVALASPLPKFEFMLGNQRVSVVPFAKTVDGASTNRTKGFYQPTDPIVDLYIEEMSSDRIKFRVNYEADEQGNDFDMDVIGDYEFKVNANKTLTATVRVIYEATGSNQNIGYVISGTNRDGVYLVAQDKNENLNYFLNVPPGRDAGYCDVAVMPSSCNRLPYLGATPPADTSVQVFSAGGKTAATTLKSPLWYAAKWGGFIEQRSSKNNKPDLLSEWDLDEDGNPDNYFLVQNPLGLQDALRKSFDSILSKSSFGIKVDLNQKSVGGNSYLYQSTIDSENWTGDLEAVAVTASGISKTPKWVASEKLPSWGARSIFTYNDESMTGVPFVYSQLSSNQQALIGDEDTVEYIRGNQSSESKQGGSFRDRESLLGDNVNSPPTYNPDTNTVYAGANDGMLHAFDGDTGEELFAYVPNLVFTKLPELATTNYSHKFFVDGEISITPSSFVGGKQVLVASPGRGARGLFALDVSDPTSFSGSDVLWEFDASSDSVHGNDIGYILGNLGIATLENGDKVIIFGNGYNSSSGNSVLYISDIATGDIVKSFTVDNSGNNGMSSPTLFDSDLNGRIDTIYAGDLKGNLWKFDLSSETSSSWSVAYSGTPMFVANHPISGRQPITTAPTVVIDPKSPDSEPYVFFGTGSYIFDEDVANLSIQSFYGIFDGPSSISSRTSLKEREILYEELNNGSRIKVTSSSDGTDMEGKRGWYIDFVSPTEGALGERIIANAETDLSRKEPVVIVGSFVPKASEDVCDPQDDGPLYYFNAFSGSRLSKPFVDLNGDGDYTNDLSSKDDVPSSVDPDVGGIGEITKVVVDGNNCYVVSGSRGSRLICPEKEKTIEIKSGRISWREIIKD